MDVGTAAIVLLALAFTASFVVLARLVLRRVDPRWGRQWRALDRRRRAAVVRAVRRGEAVGDPRDAPFALVAVAAARRVTGFRRTRWGRVAAGAELVLAGACLAILAVDLADGGADPLRSALLAYPAIAVAAAVIAFAVAERRLAAAERANREALERLGSQGGDPS